MNETLGAITGLPQKKKTSLFANTGSVSMRNGIWGSTMRKGKILKLRYKFPYGDFENVHRCGVISAESRAGQYKYQDIENAMVAIRSQTTSTFKSVSVLSLIGFDLTFRIRRDCCLSGAIRDRYARGVRRLLLVLRCRPHNSGIPEYPDSPRPPEWE